MSFITQFIHWFRLHRRKVNMTFLVAAGYFMSFLFVAQGVNPHAYGRSKPGGPSEFVFLSTNPVVNAIGHAVYYPICRPLENYGIHYCSPDRTSGLSHFASPLILQPDSLPLPHMLAFVVAMAAAVVYSMRLFAWSLATFHARTNDE